jgi:predicted dehydrogenase
MMKVAVIGLGRMGLRHLQVVRDLGMQIVALCDQAQQSIDSARAQPGAGEARGFTDGQALLQAVRPEAVVIATTAPSHCELVCEAARNGARFILCEKPLATSVRDADRMIDVCAERGAVLAVNHQMQFMAQYTQVKAAVESPQLGGLVSILVAGSNFGLAMNGSHYFQMFRYLTGENAQGVQAWFDREHVPNPRGAQFDDRAGQVRVISSNGACMYMDCSAAAGHGLQVTYICRLGQVFVDELSGFMRTVRREDAYRELPTTRYGMPAVETIRQIEPADVMVPTRAVWEAMLAGAPFPDGEAGRHALRCLCAAHTSHDLGGVPLSLDDERIDRSRSYPWA